MTTMRNGKRAVRLVLLLLTCLGCCGSGLPAVAVDSAGKSEDERQVVAKVNESSIYEDQLTDQLEAILGKFRKFGKRTLPPDLLRQKREQVLNQLIDSTILRQASRSIKVEDIETKISRRIDEIKQGPSAARFEGKSEAEVRDWVREQVILQEYLEQNGLADPVVADKEIKAYYEENQASFTAGERVRVRHILIKTVGDASPAEKEAARLKIDLARSSIVNGEDFAEVARKFSECHSAAAGGDLSFVERGFLPAEVDQVVFSAEPGKLSEVMLSQHGYHVLEVTEKKPAGVLPYDERVKAFIGKYLQGERKRELLAAHIKELRDQARIEIYL